MVMREHARSWGPLTLDAIRVDSGPSLRRALLERAQENRWVVSDLSVGASTAHQIASEFALQLDVELEISVEPGLMDVFGSSRIPALADIISHLVDVESRGDRATRGALERVEALWTHIEENQDARLWAVVAPQAGCTWEHENVVFLAAFADRLAASGRADQLLIVALDETIPGLPKSWRVESLDARGTTPSVRNSGPQSLLPGILGPALRREFEAVNGTLRVCIELQHGYGLLAPEQRVAPEQFCQLDAAQIARLGSAHEVIVAFAMLYAPDDLVDPWQLCVWAWKLFGQGNRDLALRMLERAHASRAQEPAQATALASLLQGMRLAQGRFLEAAEFPTPAASLPAAARTFLLESKAWGLLMSGQPAQAAPLFEGAIALVEASRRGDRDHLYLLNITALCRLRLGRIDEALELEQKIEQRLARLSKKDWQLEYINSINQARLYRRKRNYVASERCLERAFETNRGLRFDGERLYAAVCRAQLARERGQLAELRSAWHQAAILWLASSFPETLSMRVSAAITGERLGAVDDLTERVSGRLLEELQRVDRESPSRVPCDDSDSILRFAYVREADCGELLGALHDLDAQLFLSRHAVPEVNRGERYCALRTYISGCVRRAIASSSGDTSSLEDVVSVLVDETLSEERSFELAPMLSASLRLDVAQVVSAAGTIELDGPSRSCLEQRLEVGLQRCIARITPLGDGARVDFRRHRGPVKLSAIAARVLEAVDDSAPSIALLGSRVREWVPPADLMAVLRALESAGLLELRLPAEVVKESAFQFRASGEKRKQS